MAAKASEKTLYHVLIWHGPDDTGASTLELVAGNVQAHSADAAIRHHAETLTDTPADGIVLIAVPSRSWKPIRVKAARQVTLSFEAA